MIPELVSVKIKDIAKIYSGNSINEKVKEQKYTGLGDGVNYISTKDIGFDSVINYDNGVKIPFNELDGFKTAPKHTVFICAEGGSAGRKIAISDKELCFVNKLFAVVAGDKVLPKYIFYSFKSEDFIEQFKGSMTGIIGGVSLNKFKELTIKIPSIEIQEKIVKKLDELFVHLDNVISISEQNSKNSEALFLSYLGGIFDNNDTDWVRTTLKDVCEKITDGTHQTPTYYDDGVVFLSSKNVTSGKIDWENIKYIDEKQHLEMSKRVSPKVGDVLLAKNGTTGVAAMVDKDVVFDIYVSLALLRAKEQILPQLLLYFVNSPIAKNQFNKRLKGIGVPNLHLQEIREVEINFPKSIEKQKDLIKQIESFLDITSKQAIRYQARKNEVIKLKNSILKQAFNGELIKE